MKITKMHGLGNDFIITEEQKEEYAPLARKLCTRRLNVGADGLMVVAPSTKADIAMRIFNADGSEAEMCGNGIRCFARYVYERGIVAKQEMKIETLAGIMRPQLIIKNEQVMGVRVDMGKPDYTAENIPIKVENPLNYRLTIDREVLPLASVLMGVPHTVLFEQRSEEDIRRLGSQIETHEVFPSNTNVNFAHVLDTSTIWVRTWERGAGRTLACGTGCSAVANIAYKKGLVGSKVNIQLETGEMQIEMAEDGRVFMTGPAQYVFKGETLGD